MTDIEETIFYDGLPVNTLAMLNRLKELLAEHDTNSLLHIDDNRIRAVLWLINSQVYGQMATIDMCKEWDELNKARKAKG